MKNLKPQFSALEWIDDVSGRAPRITAVGCERLLVENHRGIADFTEREVCLSVGRGLLRVRGEGLALNEVRPRALIVRGKIRQVEFPGGEDGQ